MGEYRSIRTAEKRAMLEAAGESWPIGIDGLPKKWNANTKGPNGGTWRLAGRRNEWARAYYRSNPKEKQRIVTNRKNRVARLMDEGRCRQCSRHLDCESDSRCWSCLDKHKENRAFTY